MILMPYWPPDTPPVPPAQMGAAPNAGPAPVPGPNLTLNSGAELTMPDASHGPDGDVMMSVSGNAVQFNLLAAPNVNPYQTAGPSAIYVGGDSDPGGRDDVAGTVEGAIAAAMARQAESQGDTHAQGSRIGDLMSFAQLTSSGAPLDPGAGPGKTLPAGGFYDPPRNYGGTEAPS